MAEALTTLQRVDSRPVPEGLDEVRLLLVVRNERLRLPYFLEHHRKIGVDRFFVIDNGSEDGTPELLRQQPDVHLFRALGPFRHERQRWKQALLERHFSGRWGLVLDADELFVFPHVEQRTLRDFCAHLDAEGARGVHAPMVDLYGDAPIRSTRYEPGASPLESCPFFDRDGYWLYYKPTPRDRAPNFLMLGGPRHRLFFQDEAPTTSWASRAADWIYDRRRTQPPLLLRWPPLARLARKLPGIATARHSPFMSKVPLVRWGADLRLTNPSLHYLSPRVPLSACWGAILHFKYLFDFAERVAESVRRGQHANFSAQYHDYQARLRDEPDLRVAGPGSQRYASSGSLAEAGLLRSTPVWDRWPRA